MSNWTGELRLSVEQRNKRSVAKDIYFRGALKLVSPVYHNKSPYPCYYLLNPGGGFLDGDRYKMEITVQENAGLLLTTQSSTKIYKTPTTQVYQEIIFNLKENSHLEYIPDALIAYQDAAYYQDTQIFMEQGATLFYADIVTPGWSPEDRHFSYKQLRLKTDIHYENELIACDHIKLEPSQQTLNDLGYLEGYTHIGSFIVISPLSKSQILDQLYDLIKSHTGKFCFGLSELIQPGFIIRIMANYTHDIERIIHLCHQYIHQAWYGTQAAFLRKY